jgi:hypothetical protein
MYGIRWGSAEQINSAHTLWGTSGSKNSRQLLLRCSNSCIHAVDHERNQTLTVHPGPVEGFNQRLSRHGNASTSGFAKLKQFTN